MKDVFHKIMSLSLAILVLGSTMSFTMAQHYCGDHLIDTSFFGDAQSCAMEKMLVEKYGPEHDKKSDCCKDEKIIVVGQDELKIQFDQLTFENIVFLQVFSDSYIDFFTGSERHIVPFEGYPPPLITQDFQLLFEQYLI